MISCITNFYTSCLTSYRTTLDLGSYEIRTHYENLKFVWRDILVPSLYSIKYTFTVAVKKYANFDIKLSRLLQFYCNSLFSFKYFSQDWVRKQIFGLNLAISFRNFNLVKFCILSTQLTNLQRKI